MKRLRASIEDEKMKAIRKLYAVNLPNVLDECLTVEDIVDMAMQKLPPYEALTNYGSNLADFNNDAEYEHYMKKYAEQLMAQKDSDF